MPARHKRLILRLTTPVGMLVALLLAVLLATVVVVAQYQTDVARETQIKLANGAIMVRGQHVEKTVLDYAAWDEAVEHLVDNLDPAWADENIGKPTFQNLGFEMAFVIGGDNGTRYAMIEGERAPLTTDNLLTGGFDKLVAAQRAGDRTASASGLVLAGGLPAIAAVAPIRRLDGTTVNAARQDLLVLVDVIDPKLLDELGKVYLLPRLRLLSRDEGIAAMTALRTVDGEEVAQLVWDEARPGDTLLRTAVPVWVILAIGFGALTAIVLRQAERSAHMIADSERRATHDTLTGLPNRVFFFDRLDHMAHAACIDGNGFAVLYLDLDGFKAVNETHGHDAGDEVLRKVASRILGQLSEHDLVARLGGDEFALILDFHGKDGADAGTVMAVGERMIAAISTPITLATGEVVRVGATIGATLAPDDATDPILLLRYADQALLLGKRSGKRQIRFHLSEQRVQLVG